MTKDDLISRQAAIDALHTWFRDGFDEDVWWNSTHVLAAIEGLPSAQPDLPIKEKCAFCPHCTNCDVNDDLSIQPCVDTISRQTAIAYAISGRTRESDGDKWIRVSEVRESLKTMPSVQPEGKRERTESAIEYCCDCIHVEMCSWYPHDGCEFVETGNYAKGYNDAKREIALSGEYERAYQRGFEDGRKSEWTAVAERGEQE